MTALRTFEEYATLVLSSLINLLFYRRKDLASTSIRRIVIIKLDHIGDVILSTPATANLRRHFPKAHITMVVNPSSEPVARMIPYVDEILCYNAKFFDRSGKAKMFNFAQALRFSREMRKQKFSLIVDMRSSFASLLFALFAKSRYRIDRGTYLIYRKLNARFVHPEHETEASLNMLAKAGIPIGEKGMTLSPSQKDIENIDLLLKACETENFIVLHPGAPMELKRWSAENFVELSRRLLKNYPARIFLVGDRKERELTHSIASAIGDQRVIDLSGRITLGELAALLRKAKLFIGNDSGPMHIASAVGTKVIGLFGPTDPRRFGPYGSNCISLRMERNCPPCARNRCKFPSYRCIDRISVDDVMKRLVDLNIQAIV